MVSSSSSEGIPDFPYVSSSSSIGEPTYGRGIYLKRYAQTSINNSFISGFRFKVVAYGGNDMPNTIFRYQREALNARDGTYRLVFDGVCSPPDIEEFAEIEPTVGVYPEFCRLEYVDLVFRSQAVAEEAWRLLVEEVASLIETLNKMDIVKPEESLKLGNPPTATEP